MRSLFARKPWLFVVGGLGLFVLLDCVFLWICLNHPVVPVIAP